MATCRQLKCPYMEICSFGKILGLQTVQTLICPPAGSRGRAVGTAGVIRGFSKLLLTDVIQLLNFDMIVVSKIIP